MITIVLNGEKTEIEADSNIEQLLQKLNIENKRLAVEINQFRLPLKRVRGKVGRRYG